MKLFILAVGNKMPEWVETSFAEYAKRMPHEASIELIEIKPEKRGGGKSVDQLMAAKVPVSWQRYPQDAVQWHSMKGVVSGLRLSWLIP